MKKKYVQTPRSYLSQSQVSLWLSSPKRYAELYFDQRDELRHGSPEMDYGKLIAEALEMGVETGDLVSDAAMLLLPKHDIRDKEFRTEFDTPNGWVTILAKPDFMDSESKSIIEVKTGKVNWTQDKAQKHLQLAWYATAVYVAHKVIPKVRLVWVETQKDELGIISPTGRVEEFEVVFTMADILRTMSLMGTVAQEIAIAWSAHVVDPRIATF